MSQKNRVYVCAECGFVFPDELAGLIEEGTQVYCEHCGRPFTLEGKSFVKMESKPPERWEYPRSFKKPRKKVKTYPTLNKAIQTLNKFSYIVILISALASLGLMIRIFWNPGEWQLIIIRQSFVGLAGILIAIIDNKYICKKIKNGNYGEVIVDSITFGILGCIIFGSGVFLLLKGVLVIIFILLNKKNQEMEFYDIGLLIKNSLNNFSAKAGGVIIIFALVVVFGGPIKFEGIPLIYYLLYFSLSNFLKILPRLLVIGIFLIIALSALITDHRLKDKIKYKQYFKIKDGVRTIILGILGVMFLAAGIFILIKGALLIILHIAKPEIPKDKEFQNKIEQRKEELKFKADADKKERKTSPTLEEIEPELIFKQKEHGVEKEEKIKSEIIKIKEEEKEEDKKKEEIEKKEKEKIEEKEKEIEIKLHESLLPVKNEKDKKLVKEYFAKIFAVLSKDIRENIKDLKIPKKEKREILRELAFLTKEQQIKYIEAIVNLYQERIPKKLIEKIRSLPNVKPEHYEKIIEQLKYMDSEEQIQFIQFLEKLA
ncbi:MAG: hypothetical protein ACQERB_03415 [Promethearchaeati archaeon]